MRLTMRLSNAALRCQEAKLIRPNHPLSLRSHGIFALRASRSIEHRALEYWSTSIFYRGAGSGTCLCTRYIRANATSVIAITT